MPRTVSIGCQDFETIQREGYFYIDKTGFIREWWEEGDTVTLITRPRRFGKTLTISMLEKFFSIEYAGRGDLFEGLQIWEDKSSDENWKYRSLQGTYPVIMISFADVKAPNFVQTRRTICRIIKLLYDRFDFLLKEDFLSESEKEDFRRVSVEMEDDTAAYSLKMLAGYLSRYYGKKVIILLDEYDTPMQEAYVYGYWEELVTFTRSLFNATFKTNPYLERAIMTGITRVSRESMFSDLNNLEVVTATTEKYEDSFGFTEKEVFAALDEFGLYNRKEEVKQWYDGFVFGNRSDIYNPWSIINYLDKGKIAPYWVNTSSNSLAGKLIQEGSPEMKMTMENLMRGGYLRIAMDEQIVFNQLEQEDTAAWNLLLASGYLKAVHTEIDEKSGDAISDLMLTNREVWAMFRQLIKRWFGKCRPAQNAFLKALLMGDVKAMNAYMNKIALQTFSYFDTGNNPSDTEPERFYHGFVLGMMVELADRYVLTSNRESGFGRYDVMLEPKQGIEADAIIIEFKVQDAEDEAELSDTVRNALEQIDRKNYEAALAAKGIPVERIRKYGFAFCGKRVLIGSGVSSI
ncbi:MAG: ATP-binding protein [Roseburia sp.]|nr:ATP-binding protein [Roseburia sp.]MCM1097557.1 ATP-binding protein [Ruminococcus flavefaciens]MCM1234517.1 ATP-binding protein [Ruminococcus flavefaciens]